MRSIAQENIDILVCNAPDQELFKSFHQKHPQRHAILVTDKPMEEYSLALDSKEEEYLNHIISNYADTLWCIHDLRITLQKIVRQDLFGLDKYLLPQTELISLPVTGTDCRSNYNKEAMKYAAKYRINSHLTKFIYGITEELLMNAIYDAPKAGGKTKYSEIKAHTPFNLDTEDHSVLSYGFDGQIFVVGVTDPFGAFQRKQFFRHVKKVLNRQDSSLIIDSKKGGAGIGLFKILYSSHALICNVSPQKKNRNAGYY